MTVQELVQMCVDEQDQEQNKIDQICKKYEAKGLRLVEGDQVDANLWQIWDFRTKKVLASGSGDAEEFYGAFQKNWKHVDNIRELNNVYSKSNCPTNIPSEIFDAAYEWVHQNKEKARKFAKS